MKKTTTLLAAALLTATLLTGCGGTTDKPEDVTPPSGTQQPADTQKTDLATQLKGYVSMLGKMDSEVVTAYGEGTPAKLDDTEVLLARACPAKLMDQDVEVTFSYDDEAKTTGISIPLTGADLDAYLKDMEAALGASKKAEDSTEGSGKVAHSWNIDNADLTLMKAYDMVSIEITPAG